ncbi:MAG: hypothetical protein ACRD3W_31250, partial [Terriglobales bacterium]
ARNEALGILARMAQGEDPARTRDITRKTSLTLGQAFEEFMQSKDFRPLTRYNYPRIKNAINADSALSTLGVSASSARAIFSELLI